MIDYNKVAARILARLKVMYPAFSNQMSADPEMMMLAIDEWSKGLNGMPFDKIEFGLERVRQSRSAFAPSLPEFIDMCGGRVKPWWQTLDGIQQRGDELGIHRSVWLADYRLEVLKAARESGEDVPLGIDEKEKEQEYPDELMKLTSKMKTNF